jgi:chromosome segregation ATPase
MRDASVDCMDIEAAQDIEKEKEIEGYIVELEALREETSTLKAELDRLNQEHQNGNDKTSVQDSGVDDIDSPGEALRPTVKSLQEELKELNSANEELKQKLGDLRDNFSAELTQMEKDLIASENENLSLNDKLIDIGSSLKENDKAKAEMEHILQGLREDLQEAMNDKIEKDRALHRLRIETDRLRKKIPTKGKPVPVILPFEIKQVGENSPVDESFGSDYMQDILNISSEEPQKLAFLPENEVPLKSSKEKEFTPMKDQAVNTDEVQVLEEMLQNLPKKNELEKKVQQQTKINSKLKHMVKNLKAEVESLKDDCQRVSGESLEKEQRLKDLRAEMAALVNDKEEMINGFRERLNVLTSDKGKIVDNLKIEYEQLLSEKDSDIKHIHKQLETSHEQLESKTNDLATITSNYEECLGNENDLEIKAKNLETEVTDLRNANEELEGRLNSLTEHAKALEVENSEFEHRNVDLEDIVSNLRKDMEVLVSHRAELEQNAADSEALIYNLREQVDGSKDDVTDSLISELRAKVLDDETKLKDLNNRLQETKKDIAIQREGFEESYRSLMEEKEGVLTDKLQCEQRVQDLRLDMEKFVKEKDEIVENLRSKMKQAVEEQGGLSEALKSEYEKMLDEKDDLVKESAIEISKLKEEVVAVVNEKDELLAQMLEFDREIDGLKEDKELLGTECDELRERLGTSMNDRAQVQKTLNIQAEKLVQLNEEANRLRQELDNSDSKKMVEEMQKEYNEMAVQNDRLREETENAIKEKDLYRSKVKKDYDRINNSLSFDLEQARAQSLEREKTVQLLRLEVEGVVKEKETLATKLRAALDKREVAVPLTGEAQSHEGFANTLQEMKSEMNKISKEYHKTRKEKDQLYTKFQKVSDGLRKNLKSSLKENEELSKKLDKLESENKSVKQSLREKDSAIFQLKKNFEHIGHGWRSDLDTARCERDEANSKLKALQDDKSSVDSNIKEGEHDLSPIKTDLQSKLNSLESENSKLQERRAKDELFCNELASRINELEQKKNILEYELENSQSQLRSAFEKENSVYNKSPDDSEDLHGVNLGIPTKTLQVVHF